MVQPFESFRPLPGHLISKLLKEKNTKFIRPPGFRPLPGHLISKSGAEHSAPVWKECFRPLPGHLISKSASYNPLDGDNPVSVPFRGISFPNWITRFWSVGFLRVSVPFRGISFPNPFFRLPSPSGFQPFPSPSGASHFQIC